MQYAEHEIQEVCCTVTEGNVEVLYARIVKALAL